jgi:integrase
MKIQLPNGCSCSNLSVNPKNWQTKNPKLYNDWFINYRFYTPSSTSAKQVVIKGMNSFKTIVERQRETEKLLKEELNKLRQGYNPITKNHSSHYSNAVESSNLTLLAALEFAFKNIAVAASTVRDVKFTLSLITKAVNNLGLKGISIQQVSRKHLKMVLDEASKSSDRFNMNRSYLMILFSFLCEVEIVPLNYLRDIKKKKAVKKIRETLTDEQRKIVNEFLLSNYPEFHRFLHIFFHLGARISELMKIRFEDGQFDNQRFKITIQKGSGYREVWKTIKDVAMPYWQDLISRAGDGSYVFSKGLKPGVMKIQSYQIDKRWNRLVKKKLGITADFYSIKHLHTTEVVDLLSDVEAAKHNSHTSTNMVNQVYDVKRNIRKDNKIKDLKNTF